MAAPSSPGAHIQVLQAWPRQGEASLTALQLFEALDVDNDGFISLEEVVHAWPLPTGQEARHVKAALSAADLSSAGLLAWLDFRDVVRLWHVTGGHIPSLRRFLCCTIAESAVSATLAMIAAQAASMACAAAAGSSPTVWPRMAAVGGVGATVSLALFDGSCVKPLLLSRKKAGSMPASTNSRHVLFAAASLSTGVLLAPAVPILASTIGDPQTKGYGPLAIAGLALVHASAHSVVLAALPEQCLPNIDSGAASVSFSPTVLASVGAGVVTAAIGTGAAHVSKREGAIRTIVLATALVSLQAAVITTAASRAYARGLPEPLRAPLEPMKKLLAVGAWAMGVSSSEAGA